MTLGLGPAEFTILKASHRFLRDESDPQAGSWDDHLAQKYYDSLYREFAVCDLKHYKSGNFALRWRTESEVITGVGESTCANTRCHLRHSTPRLTTLELPFAYEEQGQPKSALVKVVLCDKCCRKLMWKRRKEKEKSQSLRTEEEDGGSENTRTRATPHSRSRSPLPPTHHRQHRRSPRRRSNSPPIGDT